MEKKELVMGTIIVIILLAFCLFGLMGDNPFFNSNYRIKHQCDAELEGSGDPNCLNYKSYNGEWYTTEQSEKIAERSGADMVEFCKYHKKHRDGCIGKYK